MAKWLKKGERTGWISCKECLPDNGRQVLVTINHFNEYQSFHYSEVSIGEYWDSPEGWGGWDVIAWQELPEPYEE